MESVSGKAVEFRVAASTGHLALIARLICPAFGAALLGRRLDLSQARWQPLIGGVMPLSFPANAIGPIGPIGDLSDLLAGPIQILTDLTAGMSVSPKVLWGNVSSAVNGAAMTDGRARPELATGRWPWDARWGRLPGRVFGGTAAA